MNFFKKEYWRLFIDPPKTILKSALLHNENTYGSLSVAHSVPKKENLYIILEKIYHADHDWMSCED